jgi:sugar phosphate isomerase/epimerase
LNYLIASFMNFNPFHVKYEISLPRPARICSNPRSMKLATNGPVAPATQFANVAQPGVMISNAWPQSRTQEGATLRAIEEVLARFPFFEAFQTVDVPFAAERRAICRILRDAGHPHTYTLTRILAEQRLNLSSLDPQLRRRSCDTIIAKFEDAREAGASSVGLISGPRPADPAARDDALRALEDSLASLAAAAAKLGGLELVLEPLDFDAHKRCTLGTTREAVAMCDRLSAAGLRVRLCLDVAHLILNQEDIIAAVSDARAHIVEFHFCNAVTDHAHPLFGDHHLFFGAPGVVGVGQIAEIMAGLGRIGYLDASIRPRVYCEVWKPDGTDSLAVVAHCEEYLNAGWHRTRELSNV